VHVPSEGGGEDAELVRLAVDARGVWVHVDEVVGGVLCLRGAGLAAGGGGRRLHDGEEEEEDKGYGGRRGTLHGRMDAR